MSESRTRVGFCHLMMLHIAADDTCNLIEIGPRRRTLFAL